MSSKLNSFFSGQGPKPAPPQITEFLQNDLVAPDEVKFRDNTTWQLNLPCRATGSNKLSWEWNHNDNIINPNKFQFDDDWQLSQDGTLKAKGLSIWDSGTYQCFVTDIVTGVKTFSRKLRIAVTGKIHKNRRNKSVLLFLYTFFIITFRYLGIFGRKTDWQFLLVELVLQVSKS